MSDEAVEKEVARCCYTCVCENGCPRTHSTVPAQVVPSSAFVLPPSESDLESLHAYLTRLGFKEDKGYVEVATDTVTFTSPAANSDVVIPRFCTCGWCEYGQNRCNT